MTKSDDGHKELKNFLAGRLGLQPEQLSFLWECLREDHVIGEFDQGYAGREEVLAAARRLLSRLRGWEGKHTSPGESSREFAFSGPGEAVIMHGGVDYVRGVSVNRGIIATPLTDKERLMKEALEKFFAVHATVQPIVREFRRRFLPADGLLSYEDAQEVVERIYFAPRRLDPVQGLLGAVEQVGEELKACYPWETLDSVALFLFSGKPPSIEPIRCVNGGGPAAVNAGTIQFMPFVSEQTILNTLKNYRAYFLNKPRQKIPTAKTLKAFLFVLDQIDIEGRFPSWPTLLSLWNETYPAEKFSDRSALRRAYIRAEAALLANPLSWRHGNELTPATRRY